jgi:Transposase, Mutator family
VIRSQAVLLAIGIGWDGRRSVLAAELANRESRSSWRDFLLGLRERGLSGVEFVVSDDHAGLRQAILEVLPEAAWQRCYVGLLKNRHPRGVMVRSRPTREGARSGWGSARSGAGPGQSEGRGVARRRSRSREERRRAA